MTVRVYRWDDASAPVLTGAIGSFAALMKAVLVDGYGSKAAAGWTLAYSGTNVYGFTNSTVAGGTGRGVKITNTATMGAWMVGYEAIDGSGVLTNPFPTTAQLANGVYILTSSETSIPRPWMVVADERRFYIWTGYNLTTGTGFASTQYMPVCFAGDIQSFNPSDPYCFAVIGNDAASSTTYMGVISSGFGTATGHFINRNNSGATISKQIGKGPSPYGAAQMGTVGPAYPDPVSGGMLLAPVLVTDGESATNVIRGKLPGLYNPLHNLPGNPGDTFTGVGPLSGKTFILLDAGNFTTRARIALEISDTW